MAAVTRLTAEALARYLEQCPDEVQVLVLELREVVLQYAPLATEAIKFHSLCYFVAGSPYGAIGGNICTIDGRSGVVILGFIQGVSLPDPQRLLQGNRKAARFIRIDSSKQLRSKGIRNLILASAALSSARKSAADE